MELLAILLLLYLFAVLVVFPIWALINVRDQQRANDTLREVLDLTGLSASFECYDDVNSAVRSFL